ncbi:MAG: GNAT family N-acetyltransferase, partial [Tetragenococcus koreensis]|nr:GNAT family N-acetyltransferase [Tetragenococcus koreensis]
MFENEIIQLRKLAASDYTIYHDWQNDMEVMKSTNLHLDLHTLEETKQFVTTIASQSNAKAYMIVHKRTERLVGIVS